MRDGARELSGEAADIRRVAGAWLFTEEGDRGA